MLAKLPMTSELFELIEIITCFLDSPLVIVLILDLTGPILLLLTMLLILTAFLVCSFGKISLMWIMSFTLLLETCMHNFLLLLTFMLNFDLARIPLLSLRRIEGGNFETSVDLPLGEVRIVVALLWNWDDMHWWKILFLLFTMNLSHPDLYIALINYYTVNLDSEIEDIVLSSKGCCLMNDTIL